MSEDRYELSALEYLLKSAEGEKFEYKTLYKAEYDDGPFGDDRYEGIARLNLELPFDPRPEAAIFAALGLGNISDDPMSVMFRPLKLVFEENEDNPISPESSYTWANMLLVATPRDPRGPFTVSVYQDWTLVGWLGGDDAEEFATHLVDNFDFGCAVVPADCFDEFEGETVLFYYSRRNPFEVDELRLRTVIRSKELAPPSKLSWNFDPEYLELKRNISWDGAGEYLFKVENIELLKYLIGNDNLGAFLDQEIKLVPDVWHEDSTAVFAFINDDFVGRFIDPIAEARFHEALTRFDHQVGLAHRGFLFIDGEDERPYVSIESDVRDVIRIDWAVAKDAV